MGMFDSEEIDNDLKVVQNKIKEYYGLWWNGKITQG
jgi:hypothetical protein